MKSINVISLCDGIATARMALKILDIPVNKYYAFEIDNKAISIAKHNFSDIIEMGDIRKINYNAIEKPVDILFCGSPCQNLSIAGDKTGLTGKASSLFYDCVKILNYFKPKYFLFENVASMTEENKKIISDLLGVKPILINSKYFLPQDRKRLYWTNIPNIKSKPDIIFNYSLNDILQDENIKKDYQINSQIEKKDHKSLAYKKAISNIRKCNEISKTLCTAQTISNSGATNVLYPTGNIYKLTEIECERLQGFPDNYTANVCKTARYKALGNSWTVPVITHILKEIKG